MAKPPTGLDKNVHQMLSQMMQQPISTGQLNSMLRLLMKWRSAVLIERTKHKVGNRIQTGPFAGVVFNIGSSEGGLLPRKLGYYESCLHPVFERIIKGDYAQIIDVGCAEGLYAVGLALRCPNARIIARDVDDNARKLCATLAADNTVAERIEIGGVWTHDDFQICNDARTVVVSDIEGAELELLDPKKAQALVAADVLVECHPIAGKSAFDVADIITDRFSATHDIQRIARSQTPGPLPNWAEGMTDADRLIMLWEWRATPTPWLWMTKKAN